MSRRTQRTVGDMASVLNAPERNQELDTNLSSESDLEEMVQQHLRPKSAQPMKKNTRHSCPVHPEDLGYQMPANSSATVSSKFYKNLPSAANHTLLDPEHSSIELSLAQIGFDSNTIDNWSGILQPPKTDLFELLRQMIINFEKTNVQIRIAETTFNCHMLVLQCYSEFFMHLNGENQVVLPADKVTPQAFHKVYEWMLSSQPIVQREGILELFNAAQFLKIRGLVAQCWVCLDDDERFSEDAAFLLYLEARALGQDELIQRLMLNRVSKFFLTLVASKEFLEFDAAELCRLLGSNSIGVNSETDVLMAAARWLDYRWTERQQHLLEVMRCVRFGLMAPWQLVELKRNVDVKEIQRFVEPPPVQKMIDDALSYVTTKYWYANNENTVQHYLERLQFTEPLERQWVTDQLWNSRFMDSNQMCVSYASFCEYLGMIRSMGRAHWRTLHFSESNPNALVQEQRLVSRLGHQTTRDDGGSEGTGEAGQSSDVDALSMH